MRIFRTSQATPSIPPETPKAPSKIPDSVGGKAVHPQARQVIESLDARHNLTVGEIEWVLNGLEVDYGYLSDPAVIPNQDKLTTSLDRTFEWARETGKSLLGMSSTDAFVASRSHRIDKHLLDAFGNQQWILNLTRGKGNDFKESLALLNRAIPGGMTQQEAGWLFDKAGLSRNYSANQAIFESTQRDLANVVKWSRATGTPLSSINDAGTARVLADEWSDYQRKVNLSKRLSKKSLKTVRLSGKWKAVWIDPEAVARPPSEDNPDDGGADNDRHDYEIEKEITGIRMNTTNYAISIRDPNGVPQATIELSAESPAARIEVYDVATTNAAKPYVKELVKKLASEGTKMWWEGDAEPMSSIRDIKELAYDEYGFVPSLRLPRIGTISDVDSYKEAIELAYQESWGGSYFYDSEANKIVDALADYAEQRGELNLLEGAREQFADWAMEQWPDTEYELIKSGSLPKRPDEDDPKYNRGGKFNSKKHNADMEAWYKESAPYEEDFEPNKFDNMVYKAGLERREKPENKAYYDEVERKAKEEAERRRKADEEKAIGEATETLRDMSRRLTDEIASSTDDFDDDHEIVASARHR